MQQRQEERLLLQEQMITMPPPWRWQAVQKSSSYRIVGDGTWAVR